MPAKTNATNGVRRPDGLEALDLLGDVQEMLSGTLGVMLHALVPAVEDYRVQSAADMVEAAERLLREALETLQS